MIEWNYQDTFVTENPREVSLSKATSSQSVPDAPDFTPA